MAEKKAGRYELLEELGRGAMGVVWKGFDPTIGRTVAVKTMKLTEEGSGLQRPDIIVRFQNETRAAGLLTHPNIVVIYDAGEDEGTFYITMEYIQGNSLQGLVDKKQIVPVPRIIKIMEQVCSGLGYAHQHNVIHRDVKPANIMLTADDTVKITDFGMAKILQLGTTQTGQIVGTPSYMSPEQVKGKPIDGRSDVFSLGVVLYELVTGEKPFPGQSVTTVIYKIVNEEPIPAMELDTSIHPGLNRIIDKALEKEPDERYQSCQQLIEDLRRFRDLGVRDANKTVVVAGRSPFAPPPAAPPPPPPPPKHESSGTITGVPVTPLTPPAPAPAEPVQPPAAQPAPPPPQKAQPVPWPAAPPPPPPPAPAHRSSTTLPPLPYTPPEPPPKSKAGYVWLSLVLVALLAAGGYVLWPTIQQTLGIGTPPQQSIPDAQKAAPSDSAPAPAGGEEKPPEAKPEHKAPPAKAAAETQPESSGSELTLQKRIEQRLASAGFGGKVRVEISGETVTLSGSLKAAEKRRLIQVARAAAGKLKIDDRIEIASASAPGDEKPSTSPGKGEIEVVTDVLGAKAVLKAPNGQTQECTTPCRFEDLAPGRYTMNVTHPSGRPINRIIEVRAGQIKGEPLTFQPYASGISITSRPPGAEVFINGQKQPDLTPTTVKLAPGTYTVRVQKQGYEPFEQSVPVAGDSLPQLNVQLPERTRGMGFVEVRTVPPGAEIFVNGSSSGRKTPFTLQLPPGRHVIGLILRGYRAVQKEVVVESNKSTSLNEVLPK